MDYKDQEIAAFLKAIELLCSKSNLACSATGIGLEAMKAVMETKEKIEKKYCESNKEQTKLFPHRVNDPEYSGYKGLGKEIRAACAEKNYEPDFCKTR